ncbi:MAG: hypothetical protein RR361_01440 [Anaerovorax sp.]
MTVLKKRAYGLVFLVIGFSGGSERVSEEQITTCYAGEIKLL